MASKRRFTEVVIILQCPICGYKYVCGGGVASFLRNSFQKCYTCNRINYNDTEIVEIKYASQYFNDLFTQHTAEQLINIVPYQTTQYTLENIKRIKKYFDKKGEPK